MTDGLTGETIAAVATAAGASAIAVIRISGPAAPGIGRRLSRRTLRPRVAELCTFRDAAGAPIDQGFALYFPAPRSYTGEHMLELQGHGGRVVSGMLLQSVLAAGARLARPGEFSERAFLNGKLELSRAEAVADLIYSSSEQAARAAARSLTGEFATAVRELQAALTELRVRCEAAIDFSEEDLAPLRAVEVTARMRELHAALGALLAGAQRGRLLHEGLDVLICGPPNVGKSTLFNALCGMESAIVSATPGTTRDLLHAELSLDGLRLRLLDSAGLRAGGDEVEREGMRRTRAAARQADLLLYVTEAGAAPQVEFPPPLLAASPATPLIMVWNKVDLAGQNPGLEEHAGCPRVRLSARTGAGLEDLVRAIQQRAGFQGDVELREGVDNTFLARARHQQALERAHTALERNLRDSAPLELMAEDLAEAVRELGELLGEQGTEELLGEIFSRFCVGK